MTDKGKRKADLHKAENWEMELLDRIASENEEKDPIDLQKIEAGVRRKIRKLEKQQKSAGTLEEAENPVSLHRRQEISAENHVLADNVQEISAEVQTDQKENEKMRRSSDEITGNFTDKKTAESNIRNSETEAQRQIYSEANGQAQTFPKSDDRKHLHTHRNPFRRHLKLAVALAAVIVLVPCGIAVSASKGWDVELARSLGITDSMKEYKSGYVNIGVSGSHDGVTVTANQAIGDDTSQWIQIDTNIDWKDSKKYDVYYDAQNDLHVYKALGREEIDGGFEFQSFNNDGKVSFYIFPTAYKDINHAKMEVDLADITRELYDEDGKLVSSQTITDHRFVLHWKNSYDAKVRTFQVNTDIKCSLDDTTAKGKTTCHISEVRITPVTLYYKWKLVNATYKELGLKGTWDSDHQEPLLTAVRLKNGKTASVEGKGGSSGFNKASGSMYLTLVSPKWIIGEEKTVNGSEITSLIFENNQEIKLR